MTRLLPALAVLVGAGCANDVGDAPAAETAAVDSAAADAPLDFSGTALPIVPDDSTVTWIGAKLTGNHVGGFRGVTGSVYVDGQTVTGADVRIDATTVYSDNDNLTEHLRSGDFFEVETHPEARFQTNSLRAVAAADSLGEGSTATHMVTGRLTMRGRTNEVTFPATVAVENGRATVQAAFLIDRTDWGIVYPGMRDDLINEQVRISLDVVAGEGGEAAPVPDAGGEGAAAPADTSGARVAP